MTDRPSLFGGTFARGPVGALVSSAAWLQALLDVEGALARAGVSAGAIPAAAGAAISAACAEGTSYDIVEIATAAADSGSPVVPLVPMIRARVGSDAARYVHVGATSQDIVDSAMMLLSRRAVAALGSDLARAADAAAGLARDHRDTPMIGRSLMQQALPTTFGLLAAGWMSALDAAGARLQRAADACPVQYGGPVGTLATAGPHGRAVRTALADELGLRSTAIAWATDRTPVLDLAGALGIASGAIGTAALDVVLLSQSEVGEVSEGVSGRGGSSSMPHKHNSIAAISARACVIRVPGLVATLFRCAEQEYQRAAGAWSAEWETLSDLLRLTGSGAAWLGDALSNLTVDGGLMQSRAERTLADNDSDDDLARHVSSAAEQVDAALTARPGASW
jgi:3-carboxy-cis,cis-muconate cycloisomerase